MKLILLAIFFNFSSLITVQVYGTLWSGVSVLSQSKNAHTRKIKNYIFDMGISWGALSLSLSAFSYFVVNVGIKFTRKF